MTPGTEDTALARALEGIADGIVLLNHELRVEFANPAAERIFGVSKGALLGRTLADASPELFGSEGGAQLVAALTRRSPFELELLAPTGRRVACRASQSGGGLTLFLRERLEPRAPGGFGEARQAREQILSIVSHDLRGPLNAIALNAAVLAKRPGDPRALEAIKTGLAQAHRLIEDLVIASRVEAGTLALKRQPEPLGAMVDEVVAQQQALAQAKAVQLEVSVDGADAAVLVDRPRLVQALSTLVGRATVASPRGERVTLRARASAGRLEVDVEDAGPGLTADEAECLLGGRCWDRLRTAKTLGLCIAKGLAEAHGGDVTAEPVPDRGTRLTLVIPPPAVEEREASHASAP